MRADSLLDRPQSLLLGIRAVAFHDAVNGQPNYLACTATCA